jgi:hypothetical protein
MTAKFRAAALALAGALSGCAYPQPVFYQPPIYEVYQQPQAYDAAPSYAPPRYDAPVIRDEPAPQRQPPAVTQPDNEPQPVATAQRPVPSSDGPDCPPSDWWRICHFFPSS